MQPVLKLMSTQCLACGEHMIPDKYNYYTCPGCGGQFCPPDESKKQQYKVILACARNDGVSAGLMNTGRKNTSKGASGGKKRRNQQKKARSNNYTLYVET